MINNGDIIIKNPVRVDFTVGKMKFKNGNIATDSPYVSSAKILNGDIEIEDGEILFTKVTEEEYRIV